MTQRWMCHPRQTRSRGMRNKLAPDAFRTWQRKVQRFQICCAEFCMEMAVMIECMRELAPFAAPYTLLVQDAVNAAVGYMRGEIEADDWRLNEHCYKPAVWAVLDGRVACEQPEPVILALDLAHAIEEETEEPISQFSWSAVDYAARSRIKLRGGPQW